MSSASEKDGVWAINGTGWVLPISANWRAGDVVHVVLGAGIPLLKIQHDALVKALRCWENHGYTWCHGRRIRSLGRPVHSDNPEHVVRWTGIIVDEPGEPDAAWIDYLANSGLFFRNYAVTFWAAVRKMAAQWLINERRVLDLGFCRIGISRNKSNWCAMLEEQRFDGDREMLTEYLKLNSMMAVASDGGSLARLEIVEDKSWFKDSMKMEIQRTLLHPDYWASVRDDIDHWSEFSHEVWRKYCREKKSEISISGEGWDQGAVQLQENWGTDLVDPETGLRLAQICQATPDGKEQSADANMDGEAEGLPALLDF